ncbi:MAG: IS5/IS1182 family transposase, partial [Chlamydiae bacterium]
WNDQKNPRYFYSGKKSQVIVDKKSRKIICTAFTHGKRHDFRLFKESKVHIHSNTKIITGIGYQGRKKLHEKTHMPKRKRINTTTHI